MTTFDLELRVTTYGSILTWRVMLEDSTNEQMKVLDWLPSAEGYRFKKLPSYQIKDNALEVFASCNGIAGGSITCEVFVNDKLQTKKVIAGVTDKVYAAQSYTIAPKNA